MGTINPHQETRSPATKPGHILHQPRDWERCSEYWVRSKLSTVCHLAGSFWHSNHTRCNESNTIVCKETRCVSQCWVGKLCMVAQSPLEKSIFSWGEIFSWCAPLSTIVYRVIYRIYRLGEKSQVVKGHELPGGGGGWGAKMQSGAVWDTYGILLPLEFPR